MDDVTLPQLNKSTFTIVGPKWNAFPMPPAQHLTQYAEDKLTYSLFPYLMSPTVSPDIFVSWEN